MLPKAILISYSESADDVVAAVARRRADAPIAGRIELTMDGRADVALAPLFDDLALSVMGTAADLPIDVFHLVGDLDAPEVVPPRLRDLDSACDRVAAVMRRRFPNRLRQWVIGRFGEEVSELEQTLLAKLAFDPRFVTLVVPRGTSVATIDFDDVVLDRTADIVHAVGVSDVWDSVFDDHVGRIFWVGCGAVRVETGDGVDAGALRDHEGALGQLGSVAVDTRGFSRGQGAIRSLKLGALPGAQDHDPLQADLGAGGVSGSAEIDPIERLLRLESDIDRLPPELWAGYIREVIDRTCTAGGTSNAVRSPLQRTFQTIDDRSVAQAETLEGALDQQARTTVVETGSIPNLVLWCEGAVAALEESAAILRSRVVDERDEIDLAAAHNRLDQAAGRLPFAWSTFVRALLITVIALVVHYAFAPVALLIASATGRALPPIGSSFLESARVWARILALLTGVAVWAWWEWSWRRVLRFRRRYIRAAEEMLRSSIRLHLVRRRIWVIERLIGHIGDASEAPGTVRGWAKEFAAATTSLLAMGPAATGNAGTTGRDNPWSVVLSAGAAAAEPSEIDERFDAILRAMCNTPLDCSASGIADAALAVLRARRLVGDEALAAALHERRGVDAAVRALVDPGTPYVPPLDGFDRGGNYPYRILPAGVRELPEPTAGAGNSHAAKSIASIDEGFGALLWVTPVTVHEELSP